VATPLRVVATVAVVAGVSAAVTFGLAAHDRDRFARPESAGLPRRPRPGEERRI
jgi:hypothetical protein